MPPLPPVTYTVVLIPSDQVTMDGCKPGRVKLTGTPGEGTWDEWGPYWSLGELTPELAALGFGVPQAGGDPADVPSGS